MRIKIHGKTPNDIALKCDMRTVLNLTKESAFALYRDWFNAVHFNSIAADSEYAFTEYDFRNTFPDGGYKIISCTSNLLLCIYRANDSWYLISFDAIKFYEQWRINHPKYDAPYSYSEYAR